MPSVATPTPNCSSRSATLARRCACWCARGQCAPTAPCANSASSSRWRRTRIAACGAAPARTNVATCAAAPRPRAAQALSDHFGLSFDCQVASRRTSDCCTRPPFPGSSGIELFVFRRIAGQQAFGVSLRIADNLRTPRAEHARRAGRATFQTLSLASMVETVDGCCRHRQSGHIFLDAIQWRIRSMLSKHLLTVTSISL